MCFLWEWQWSPGWQVVNKFRVKGGQRSGFPVYHVLSLRRPDIWNFGWVLSQTFQPSFIYNIFFNWFLSGHPSAGQLHDTCVWFVLRSIFWPTHRCPRVSFPALQTLWFSFTIQRRSSERRLFSKVMKHFYCGCWLHCFVMSKVLLRTCGGAFGWIKVV